MCCVVNYVLSVSLIGIIMVLFLVGVLIILHESVDAMTRLANISSLTPPLSLTISVMINVEYSNGDDYNDIDCSLQSPLTE